MTDSQDSTASGTGEAGVFVTTHWSLVLAAGDSLSPRAQEALAELCRSYWYPLYAFVRRQGHSPPDAQDLTQEFFARLLQSDYFARADRQRGRFRSFLLASLKHFLNHEWEKARALKRGGGRRILPLDPGEGEDRYCLEPADPVTAETLFERRWALTLLSQVLARLRHEFTVEGRQALFNELKPALQGERTPLSYAEIGARFGLSEGAVKVAVHRLRRRYAELLRDEIARTVSSPAEVEGELRHLLAALAS